MGRFLYDPCGNKVLVRGIEQMFWSTSWISPSFVDEIAKSGANTTRILPQISSPTPDGKPAMSLAAVESLIKLVIADKMMVDIAVDGGSNPDIYLRDDVKALLLKYERYLVIHAKGESTEGSENEWVANAKSVVSKLRAAGYKAPLYLLPITYGRNLPVVLNRGQEVLDSDPLKNIIFGWQAYWGSSNYYQKKFGMTLAQAMAKVAAASFMIQVGLLKETDPGEYLDYSPVMADAQANGVSWLWWDWRMSGSNLTTDGTFGHWASDGQQVVVSNANGVQKTSVRSPFQIDGACK
jgi:mannan endo-1,4-beta-mannosidase